MPQVVLQVCSVYTLESSCHKMLWKLYFSCKQIMVHYFWQNDRLIMRGLSFCNHIWGRVIVSEPPHDTSTSPLLVTPGSALFHSQFPIIANKASWWWLLVMAGLHDTRRRCELDSRWSGPMFIPILRQGECPASLLMSPSIGGHANYDPPGDGGARSMVTWPVTSVRDSCAMCDRPHFRQLFS